MPKTYILFLSFLLSFSSFVHSQREFRNLEAIDLYSGLSHNNIYCIEQDDYGFMWFGTGDGLNKYDGYNFTVYRSNVKDPTSLSNSIIRCLYKDSIGNLWIGTDVGVNRLNFHSGEITRFGIRNGLSNNSVRAITAAKGYIWVATIDDVLNRLDLKTNKFKPYIITKKDTTSKNGTDVHCMSYDSRGNIWIGSGGSGLWLFDIKKERFSNYSLVDGDDKSIANNSIRSITLSMEGTAWLGTLEGLTEVNIVNGDLSFANFKFSNKTTKQTNINWVTSTLLDTEGLLWVGFRNFGVSIFDTKKKEFIKQRLLSEIVGTSANIMFEDHTGVIWYGTFENGIKKLNKYKDFFGHHRSSPCDPLSLNCNIINALWEDKNSSVWVGTSEGGLNRMIERNGKVIFEHYLIDENDIKPSAYISSVIQDNKNRLWVLSNTGIFTMTIPELEAAGKIKSSFRIKSNGKDIGVTPWYIMQDSKGIFWISTQGGLVRYDYYNVEGNGVIYKNYKPEKNNQNSIISARVWNTYEDKNGYIWVSTTDGLSRFDRNTETFKTYLHFGGDPSSMSSSSIKCIYEDSKENFWIGTLGSGLNKMSRKAEKFKVFNKTNNLPNDVVYGILEDHRGYLWISTNQGLSRFNPLTEQFSNFDVFDGLQSNEFRMNAFHKGHSGTLYFGGINGFNAFNPDSIRRSKCMPIVVFTALKIFNKDVITGKKYHGKIVLTVPIYSAKEADVSYRDNMITIGFSALHYNNPSKNKYMYRLVGFEEKWSYVDASQRSATYTNLRGGDYTFVVRASNSDGVWTSEVASLNIHVRPPFWQTIYFYALMVLLISGIVYIIIRVREKRFIESEKILNIEKELLQALMDNVPDSIYFKDADSRFIRINKAKSNDIGLAYPDEAIGKSDFDYFSADDARDAYHDEQNIIKNNRALVNKLEKRERNGELKWTLATKVPIFNPDGSVAGTVGITRNITEQMKVEDELKIAKKQAEDADRLKSAFLANMSHEIRTPMNAIIGFSDLLSEANVLDEDREMYISYIRLNGERLLYLIDDIIDTAKIEANQIVLNKSSFNLNRVLIDIKAFFENEKVRLNKEHISIKFTPHTEDAIMIYTDKYRFRQVMINLINNALKFTDNGFVEFGYLIDGKMIEFFVKDTGIGIDADKQDLVFMRFGHFENRFKINIASTGLGLYICKNMVNLMDGDLQFESAAGAGSVFRFKIPM